MVWHRLTLGYYYTWIYPQYKRLIYMKTNNLCILQFISTINSHFTVIIKYSIEFQALRRQFLALSAYTWTTVIPFIWQHWYLRLEPPEAFFDTHIQTSLNKHSHYCYSLLTNTRLRISVKSEAHWARGLGSDCTLIVTLEATMCVDTDLR
jgi:hypothetical protein